MTIAYRTGTAGTVPFPALALTVDISGCSDGDLMVVSCCVDQNRASSVAMPAGWDRISVAVDGGLGTTWAGWTRTKQSGDTNPDITWTGNAGATYALVGMYDSDGNPLARDVTGTAQAGAASTTVTALGVTTTRDNTALVALGGCENQRTWTPPAGMTERADSQGILGGTPDASASVATVDQAAAGATGDKAFTISASEPWGACLLAIYIVLPALPWLATPTRKRWARWARWAQPPTTNPAILELASRPLLTPQLPHVIPARRRPQPPRPPENGSLAALFARVTVVLTDGMRLRAEVYTPAGALAGSGPIRAILSAEYEIALDRIGGWSMQVAATDANASLLTMGREVRLYREGEGLVYRGIIDKAETQVSDSGELTVAVSGLSTAEALLWANTLLGQAFNGTALSSVVSTLLTGTGWSAGALDVPSTTLLARYDGLSRWAALQKAADVFGLHLREDPYNLEADIGAFGTSSGVVFQNVGQVSPLLRENTLLYPVQSLQVLDEGADLWNSIVPLGGGDTLNQLTLRYATRSSPYAIQSATGPDGLTYYYLEDAASVAAYGRRQRVLLVKDAAPLANSAAGYQNAANALYDVAVTYLQRHKDPLTTYGVSVVGLKHFDPGSTTPRFQVGQKARLVYRGIVEDTDGTRRAWRSVDASLWLMGLKRSFKDDGSDEWSLSVATVDRLGEDDAARQAQAFSDLFALQVALKNYTSHEVHILQRSSIDASNTTTLTVKWDANVSLIHQAKLTFKILPVRSNVSTVASGGSTSPTTSSGGSSSPTSSGGASHNHSVSGQTTGSPSASTNIPDWPAATDPDGGHNHSSATTDSGGGGGGAHTHPVSGGTGTETDHTHNLGSASLTAVAGVSHTHSFSGSTSGAESSHTHTVTISAHTHTVTISDHTHAISYGIFVASNPVSTALNITINGTNRTVALGGSWSTVNSEIEVDITAYLQSGSTEIPLQQSNTIVFSGAVLADVEAVLRSRVTVASLVPV